MEYETARKKMDYIIDSIPWLACFPRSCLDGSIYDPCGDDSPCTCNIPMRRLLPGYWKNVEYDPDCEY